MTDDPTANTSSVNAPSVKRGETILAAVIALVGAVLFVMTPQLITNYRADLPFQLSPAFYPRLALVVMVIGALWQIVHLRTAEPSADEVDEFEVGDSRPRLVVSGILMFLAYVLVAPWLGYPLTTFLFVLLTGWWADLKLSTALMLATGATAVLYGVFVLALKVWFPKPALLVWLGVA